MRDSYRKREKGIRKGIRREKKRMKENLCVGSGLEMVLHFETHMVDVSRVRKKGTLDWTLLYFLRLGGLKRISPAGARDKGIALPPP